jgi:hypothetical protein
MSNFNSRSFTIEGRQLAGPVDEEEDELNLDILNNNRKGDESASGNLKDAIIDLYLNVKIRNSEDVRTKSYLNECLG